MRYNKHRRRGEKQLRAENAIPPLKNGAGRPPSAEKPKRARVSFPPASSAERLNINMENIEEENLTKKRKHEYKTKRAGGGRRPAEYPYTWRHQLLRLPWLLLLVLGFFIPKIMERVPAAEVEKIYSLGIYPVAAEALGAASSVVGFSLAETILFALLVILALILLIRLFKLVFGKFGKRHINRVRFISYLISLAIFAGITLNLFYCLWGFNHYRLPLSESMALEVKPRPTGELAVVCKNLADTAADLRSRVTEDENGIYTIGEHKKAFESVREAYANLGIRNHLFSIPPHNAKPVAASEFMSRAGTAGIYTFYTAEMNVNTDAPDLYILAVAAHETAHYMGFAREDEADFLAYYVSLFSDDVNFKYSAVMHALISCGNKLYEQDSEVYFKIRNCCFSEGMERDLDDYRAYYDLYKDDPVKAANDAVNDAYLKHNGQEDGIKSYGNMVDLVLAYFASTGKI